MDMGESGHLFIREGRKGCFNEEGPFVFDEEETLGWKDEEGTRGWRRDAWMMKGHLDDEGMLWWRKNASLKKEPFNEKGIYFGYFGMFEESPQLSTSGSARLLVTSQSNKLLLLAAM